MHDAYKINLKTKNNTNPTERKLEKADEVIDEKRVFIFFI